MIGTAQNNGWFNGNPFYGHKLTYKQTERSYLTTEELNQMMNVDLSHCNKTGQKYRDLFIFSCFTGISWIDLYNLTKSKIKTDKDGTIWLSYTRQKTETPCNLPLLEIPLRIIKKAWDSDRQRNTIFNAMFYHLQRAPQIHYQTTRNRSTSHLASCAPYIRLGSELT